MVMDKSQFLWMVQSLRATKRHGERLSDVGRRSDLREFWTRAMGKDVHGSISHALHSRCVVPNRIDVYKTPTGRTLRIDSRTYSGGTARRDEQTRHQRIISDEDEAKYARNRATEENTTTTSGAARRTFAQWDEPIRRVHADSARDFPATSTASTKNKVEDPSRHAPADMTGSIAPRAESFFDDPSVTDEATITDILRAARQSSPSHAAPKDASIKSISTSKSEAPGSNSPFLQRFMTDPPKKDVASVPKSSEQTSIPPLTKPVVQERQEYPPPREPIKSELPLAAVASPAPRHSVPEKPLKAPSSAETIDTTLHNQIASKKDSESSQWDRLQLQLEAIVNDMDIAKQLQFKERLATLEAAVPSREVVAEQSQRMDRIDTRLTSLDAATSRILERLNEIGAGIEEARANVEAVTEEAVVTKTSVLPTALAYSFIFVVTVIMMALTATLVIEFRKLDRQRARGPTTDSPSTGLNLAQLQLEWLRESQARQQAKSANWSNAQRRQFEDSWRRQYERMVGGSGL